MQNDSAPAPEKPATSLRFDFAAAARRIVDSFPQLKANTVFLDLDTPAQKYGHWKAKLAAALSGSILKAQQAMSETSDSSFAFQPQGAFGLRSLIYKPDDAFVRSLAATAPLAEAQAFVFNHEAGHLLVKDAHGAMPKGKPYPENAADSFATLSHLRDYPQSSFLPMINSWARAYRFIASGQQTHMSSSSIEAIIADHATGKLDVSALRGHKLADTAAAYAHRHAPDEAQVDEARYAAYGRFQGLGELYPLTEETKGKLEKLAESALKTESRFAFQAGLSLFRPFLHPAGVDINGVTIRLEEQKRAELAERFENRAASFGLPSLIDLWNQNVDSLCRAAEGEKTAAAPASKAKPLKLSL